MRILTAALVAALLAGSVQAAPRWNAEPEKHLIASMTREDFNKHLERLMPYPVIQVSHGFTDDGQHVFLINIDVDKLGLEAPQYHVRFQLPPGADNALVVKAITLAGRYAEKGISDALKKAQASQ